ncbi:DUF4403 family protein [Fulvivirgaceae bacterium PWU5]|uniref:DUF4403 family protein n=1 Tax=Dawidia cretensis TaxID=2782350 RepID=A0AAP2GV09_9BACT|nr:DUF4403 family protein [Dawidia cretensis]MBT1710263.1 DUF4403 family protein [Dawidia cretensis]
MKNVFPFLWLFACCLAGCERIKPEPPPATTRDTELLLPLSTVNLPVYYHLDSLAATLNSKMKGTFIRQWIRLNERGDSLYIEIARTRPVVIRWKKEKLAFAFPVSVKGKFIKHVAGFKVKNATPVAMEMDLHLATNVLINKDWNLLTETELQRIVWIKDPFLKIAMVRINLRKIVEQTILSNREALSGKMDQVLHDRLATRTVIEKLWNDIQKPIRINKKGTEVWLKPTAQDLQARVTQRGNFIVLETELKAYVRTVLETQEMPATNTVLPPYKAKTTDTDSLTLYVLARLPFQTINSLLKKELGNHTFTAQGYSTTLKDLDVYGTEEGIAIRLQLRGDVDGQVYMRGVLAYDTVKAVFFVQKFNFDVDSQNSLVNSADWLLHDNMLEIVNEKLTIHTQSWIDQLPGLIEKGVENGRSGDKINLQVAALDVKPLQIIVTKNDVQVVLKATGQATIGLHQKVFKGKKKKNRPKALS